MVHRVQWLSHVKAIALIHCIIAASHGNALVLVHRSRRCPDVRK